MHDKDKVERIEEVMGAAHVFCSAVDELLDFSLRKIGASHIAMSQVKLLLLIARPGQRVKLSGIAGFLGVTNAAVSRAVDRLVNRGLVARNVSREDRRAVDLALTPQGRDLLDRFSEARNARLLELLADVPDEKLRRISAVLDDLSVLLLDPDAVGQERCLRCNTHFRSGCVVQDVRGRACATASQVFNVVAPTDGVAQRRVATEAARPG